MAARRHQHITALSRSACLSGDKFEPRAPLPIRLTCCRKLRYQHRVRGLPFHGNVTALLCNTVGHLNSCELSCSELTRPHSKSGTADLWRTEHVYSSELQILKQPGGPYGTCGAKDVIQSAFTHHYSTDTFTGWMRHSRRTEKVGYSGASPTWD